MAASLGETRKRSNTAGSTDEEERVVLLSSEDVLLEANTDSNVSDDNQEDSEIQFIKPKVNSEAGSLSRKKSFARGTKRLYRNYCTPK